MPRTRSEPKVCYSINTVLLFLIAVFGTLTLLLVIKRTPYDYPPTPMRQQQQQPMTRPQEQGYQQGYHQGYHQSYLYTEPAYASRRFNRIGHLVCEDTKEIKPLYGRPKDRRGNKWHYYTSEHIDSNLNEIVQLPIIVNNRECMNDWGCDELYDNDTVRVDNHGNTFRVKLYKKLIY